MSSALNQFLFAQVTEDQQRILRYWWDHRGQRPGLWVYGPRRSGTSYVAGVGCRKASGEMDPEEWQAPHIITAVSLIENLRLVWTLEDQAKRHPDDYGLWSEYDVERRLWEWIAVKPVLWVDDMHSGTLDMSFWRRHVQEHLEQRVKRGQITIVATTYAPDDDALEGLTPVILDLFEVIKCESRGTG